MRTSSKLSIGWLIGLLLAFVVANPGVALFMVIFVVTGGCIGLVFSRWLEGDL